MGGFSSGPAAPQKSQAQIETERAQARQSARAEAATQREQQGVQARRRLMRSGGLRLLFSPLRQEGPGAVGSTKLGGGS